MEVSNELCRRVRCYDRGTDKEYHDETMLSDISAIVPLMMVNGATSR